MKTENKILKFLSGKGFYAAVGVCLLALGITAIAVTNSIPKTPNITEEDESFSSVQIITDTPSIDTPALEVGLNRHIVIRSIHISLEDIL